METHENNRFAFDEFELDCSRRILLREGKPLEIKAKMFDLLRYLVENHGKLLSKNELLENVWPGQFVEENNLSVQISALRKTLGKTKSECDFISTVPGVGYSFVEDVVEVVAEEEIILESRHFARIVVQEEIISGTDASDSKVEAVTPHRDLSDHSYSLSSRTLLLGAAVLALSLIAGLSFWQFQSFTSRPIAAPMFQKITFSPLTSSGRVEAGAISPDGKYFVYAQKESEGESLWVRQVNESKGILLIPEKRREYWGLTFSPDSTRIYATVFANDQADPKLISLPVLGGAIVSLPNVSCSGISFSPDGRRFAYVVSSSSSGGTLLRTANADGSDDSVLAIIKDPGFFVFPGPTVTWSPDGKTLATAVKMVDESGEYGSVIGVDAVDGTMHPLTTRRFPWIQSVVYLADGALLFSANEDSGSPMQIWHQPIGHEPNKITNDLESYSWVGATADGKRIIAGQHKTTSSLSVANYTTSVEPFQQIHSEIGNFGEIGWTPDDRLIYRSQASGKSNLWLINSDGSEPAQLTVNGMPDNGLSVSPNGQFVVFSSFRANRYNLWRIDSDGSNLLQLTNGSGEAYPRVSPDGESIIYQQGVGEVSSNLWSIPIDGGEGRQITNEHSIYPAISRDGKLAACFYIDTSDSSKGQWSIRILDTTDGSRIQSFAMPKNLTGRFVRWLPDGSGIAYARSNGTVGSLWKQPLDGSKPTQIVPLEPGTIRDFAWSSSGKQIAVSYGTEIGNLILLTSGG